MPLTVDDYFHMEDCHSLGTLTGTSRFCHVLLPSKQGL